MPKQNSESASLAEARASVFTEYAPALHRLLRRWFARNGADVEDLMQEIAIAFAAVPQATVVQDPAKYLFGIAWHIGCRYLTSKTRDRIDCRSGETRESLGYASIEAAEFDAISDDMIKQILRLPWVYQQILTLKMETDLTTAEIAQQLRLSEATVKKYLVKAKARLRLGGL